MRTGLLVGLIALVCLMSVEVSANPVGVWVPAKSDNRIARIHISGIPLSYTATIDYRCLSATCSTLQSVIEDTSQHPSIYSVQLDGVGPTPVLVLRWLRGPPCNRLPSDENPVVFWGTTATGASRNTGLVPVGRPVCFVHAQLAKPR